MNDTIQCVFVNTEQKPLEIRRMGLFKYSKGFDNKINFSELCEVFYPHPDAPNDLKISVFQFLTVGFPRGFENTAIQCIDAMKGLEAVKI